jgi:HTH-type transcriptional regulator/antitoxin HigA
MSTLTRSRGATPEYLELIQAFPLRSIRSAVDYSAATKILARLLGRPSGRLSRGERDYADVLGRLIDDYGQRQLPHFSSNASTIEVLRFLMAEHGMNTEALGKIIGNKTAASLVLNGKRELSKSHIRRLATHFNVDAGIFL